MEIRVVEDNTDKIIEEVERRCQAALEACGLKAVAEADRNVNKGVPRHAGSWYTPQSGAGLRGSINHKVKDDTCYVGTNNEHAIYNEYGTGIYVEDGSGRKSPWAYQDDRGNWHRTRGITPLHFLKNAIADHVQEYKAIMEQYLKG